MTALDSSGTVIRSEARLPAEGAPAAAKPVVVSVELYGIIRDLVKDRNLEVRLPDRESASYRGVLESLVERFGPAFRDRLFGSQGLLSFVKVFAGGKPVTDLDEALPAGDDPVVRIIVFAAAGGG